MYIIIHLFIVMCLYGAVKSQICTKTEIVPTTVSQLYVRTGMQTFHSGSLSGYAPILTRRISWTASRRKTVMRRRASKFCCHGYIRVDDSPDDNNIQCKAICTQACVNGYCESPGNCSCNDGYAPTVTDTFEVLNNFCIPVCTETCKHATCVAPETCSCHFGYVNSTGTCQPVCTEPCHNGVCTAPETCSCNPGYRKYEDNICQPYCSHGCDNGFCSAPETCTCNPGYEIASMNNLLSFCHPVCSEPCLNGICIAPNECNCLPKYRKSSETKVCEPICSKSCENGFCSAPETCTCNTGYEMSNTNDLPLAKTCEPVCSILCTSGKCIAPDTCGNVTDDEPLTIPDEVTYETSNTLSDDFTNTPIDANDSKRQHTYLNNSNLVNGSDVAFGNSTGSDTSDGEKNSTKNTWVFECSVVILVAVIILITTFIWKCSPIVMCFPQKCYVIQAPAIPHSLETVQFSEIRDKGTNKS